MTDRLQPGRARALGTALILAVLAANVLTPTVGWAAKALTKGKALKLFYTKAQADARYLTQALGDGRYLTEAQADGRYLSETEGNGLYLTEADGDQRYYTEAEIDALLDEVAEPDLAAYCGDLVETSGYGPCIETRAVVDTGTDMGEHTSIAIGVDGNPVISYNDNDGDDLEIAKCFDPACLGPPQLTTADSTNNVGKFTSIAIGSDGRPVISYHAVTGGDLKFVRCTDIDCASVSAPQTVDSGGANVVGLDSSIAIAAGAPVISYHDGSVGALKLALCESPTSCATPTIRVLQASPGVGRFTSVAVLADGRPVVSYQDDSLPASGDLQLAVCLDVTCSSAPAIRVLRDNGPDDLGVTTSVAIGTDGAPIVTGYDDTNNQLEISKCADADCTADTDVELGGGLGLNDEGQYSSVAIGTDGNPVVAFQHVDIGSEVMLLRCPNPSCSGLAAQDFESLDGVAAGTTFGQFTSLAIGADGVPVVSYHDGENGALKVARPAAGG